MAKRIDTQFYRTKNRYDMPGFALKVAMEYRTFKGMLRLTAQNINGYEIYHVLDATVCINSGCDMKNTITARGRAARQEARKYLENLTGMLLIERDVLRGEK